MARAYTLTVQLTPATRREIYTKLALIFDHITTLGVDIVSFSLVASTITVTLSAPISADQATHLGLT